VRVAAGLGRGQDGQECVGEQRQDGPSVPGGPAPDLVLVRGGELLAASESVLSMIAGSAASIGAQFIPAGAFRAEAGREPLPGPGGSRFASSPAGGGPVPVIT
jgi:hypothetical protein